MIPISTPIIGELEKEAVLAVLSSGKLAQGPKVQEFEEHFASMCGVKYAIATSSGTTALHVALLAHGIGPNDEVITTPFSFVATANVVLHVGAKPVFVDIEKETFNIDPNLIEKKITPRTKAIMPVHLFGHIADMDAILDIANRYGLTVIEDACQAHGASVRGKKAGSFGTGAFSFYATKNMTTIEGGMITTDSADVDRLARMLRAHGSTQQYRHDILGFNFRMTDLQAAIGLVQLDRLPDFNQKRIENAHFLTENLGEIKSIRTPVIRPDNVHVFHQYTINVEGNRDSMLARLREKGIGAGVYYPIPIHQQPLYQELGYNDGLPVAEESSRQVLSLPVHPSLTIQDLATIVEEVRAIC